MAEADELASALLTHLRHGWRADVDSVAGLTPVTTGASQEIWAFTAHCGDTAWPLVLRRARRWSDASQAASAGMAAEAAVLKVAARGGVPVPAVRSELRPEDGLGEGYVMDRVDGETVGRRIVRDQALSQVRPRLVGECGAILARIHALPRASLALLRHGQAREELQQWLASHRASGVARPVFAWALRWLSEHLPAPVAPAVVHGDFRNGNLVVGPEGVRAVLDWELVHRGDPMEDLGWFCVNAWRFGEVGRPAGGLGSREALFAAYEDAGGGRVDVRRVFFWEVLGNLKWGIACDAMGLAWRRGEDRRIERLAVARRASEVEVDLLQLLAPQAAPDAPGGLSANGVGPDHVGELAAAVREVLATAVPSMAPTAAYDARIAMRLLEVLAREQAQGPAARHDELAGLRVLLRGVGHGMTLAALRSRLCEAIAHGDIGLDHPGLVTHLWRTALARLAIDQPAYRWQPAGE